MNDLNIEDWLHLVQGADKKVDLISVECTKVNTISNYINQKKSHEESGSLVVVSSEISLAYEVGFNITLNMESIYEGISSPIADFNSLIKIIKGGDFKLMQPHRKTASESHLFDIKDQAVMNELKRLYSNIRDLSFRDNFAWFANERVASMIVEEYKMALALNPYPQSRYFEESMRKELHHSLIEKAERLLLEMA